MTKGRDSRKPESSCESGFDVLNEFQFATQLMVYWIDSLMYWINSLMYLIHPNSSPNPDSDSDFNLNTNPNTNPNLHPNPNPNPIIYYRIQYIKLLIQYTDLSIQYTVNYFRFQFPLRSRSKIWW